MNKCVKEQSPDIVVNSVKILYFSTCVELTSNIVYLLIDGYSVESLIGILIGKGLLFSCIYAISKGKIWARFTYFALFSVGVLLFIPDIFVSFFGEFEIRYFFESIITIVTIAANLIALAGLFKKHSSEWFKSKQSNSRK